MDVLGGATTVLLGPQRGMPTVGATLDGLGVETGPVAVITAGWDVREDEILELGEHLDRGIENLELHRRAADLYERDQALHAQMREGRDRLRQLQRLYRARLRHIGPAAEEMLRFDGQPDLLGPEQKAAIDQLAALDEHHLGRVIALEDDLRERARLLDHEALQEQRAEIAEILGRCRVLCLAGGHVGILYNRLWLFGVLDLVPPAMSIVAWSAGAMALTDRIVLFHDSPPQGRGYAEVFGPGLGVCPGIVVLPHASSRLRLDDPVRVQLLARRFPDDLCVAMDEGAQVTWDGQAWVGTAGTRRLAHDGTLVDVNMAEERA